MQKKDERTYLREQIHECRRKMNVAKLLDAEVLFAAGGGVAGIVCEGVSLLVPFYYAHLAAGLCFAAGLFAGMIYAVCRRADGRRAARRIDSFGLQERMITAYECIGREDDFANMQRRDAIAHYNRIRERIKIPLLPGRRHLLALALAVAVTVALGCIPSSAREQALLHHSVQQAAKEEQETIDELLEALDAVDMDSLTEEQAAALAELMESMKLSREELASAGSWESLAAAAQKLNYKYEQAGMSLEQLAGLLGDAEAAKVASAEAIAKAAAKAAGQQMASAGTPGTGDGQPGDGQPGDGQSGDGNGDGSGDGDGNGSGDGSGDGDGSGSGSGSGSGDGGGNGSGSGSGGSGNGSGSGRGTGSSNAEHDYVSIPNPTANDPSLTGNKTGDADSSYSREQNGLSWEGDHVDYNSVIADYTDSAYESITSGRYPSGMESVIKDYFESLNQ